MGSEYELIISEQAAEEMEAIRDFNELRKIGLGFDYLVDILDCIERIHSNPFSFQYHKTAADGIRRGVSKRFSIIILYDIDRKNQKIEILLVADSRQNWQ